MSQHISSEISGFIEDNVANQKRQCLASGMKESTHNFLEVLLGVDNCWTGLLELTFLGQLDYTEVSNREVKNKI
jgi:hypothetical protein